jgi:tRNA (cmo5U34)-methyltransferase
MPEYRWNQAELAEEFDRAAEFIHPHYLAVQDAILGLLETGKATRGLIVDAGGGSGRLAQRILELYPGARLLVVDQSEAFLAIAARRMAPFGDRGSLLLARLQDDWTGQLSEAPAAIVSMSAIHHLDPVEKRDCYARCYQALRPGGVLLNGDEVRDPDPTIYKQHMLDWSAWKNGQIAEGKLSGAMAANWRRWEERNIERFDEPRRSGDDCHETIAAQLGYFRDAGFATADAPWSHAMWTVMRGVKGSSPLDERTNSENLRDRAY